MTEETGGWKIARPNDPFTRAEASAIVGQMALTVIKTASLAAQAHFGDKKGGEKTFEELKDLMDEMVNSLVKAELFPGVKSSDEQ